MPVIERYPSSTTVIVAGWVDPTNAYAFDNAFTYSETDVAEQEYDGYSGYLKGVEIIDKVFIRLKWKTSVTTVLQGDTATATCTLKVYDGSTWQSYQVTAQDFAVSTANDESLIISEGDNSNAATLIDVTAHVSTLDELNSAKTRLNFAVATAVGVTARWSVDAVSILVCYHTEGGPFIGAAKTKHDVDTKEHRAINAVTEYLNATS